MIQYPMLEISEEAWNSKRYKDFYILFDNRLGGFQFSKMDSGKEKDWFRKLQFVDAQGSIFLVKEIIESNKQGILRYLPFYKQFEFVFEQTGNLMQLEALKGILVERALEINNQALVEHIGGAKTYGELLGTIE